MYRVVFIYISICYMLYLYMYVYINVMVQHMLTYLVLKQLNYLLFPVF